jgi:hypothetical protein
MANKPDNQFQITGNGKMIFEIFPQEYLDLQAELASGFHPKIVAIISVYPAEEIDIKLAQIAAYCEVVLDGDYDINDRVKLAGVLTKKLMEKREYPEAQNIILLS